MGRSHCSFWSAGGDECCRSGRRCWSGRCSGLQQPELAILRTGRDGVAEALEQPRVDRVEERGRALLALAAVPEPSGRVGEEEAILGTGEADEEEAALLGDLV